MSARSAIPLIPDGDEARRWAEEELADPVYRTAEPTFVDRAARAVAEFFADLFSAGVDGAWGLTLAIVVAGIALVLLVAALVIWGVPRSTRRARPSAAALFGDEEERSSAQLRSAAAAAAARGSWDEAAVLRMRCLARALSERGIVRTPPGATVHAFALAATRAFPDEASALEDAAAGFDDVRYLRRPGTSDLYARMSALDDRLAAARPVHADDTAARA